VAVKLRLIRFGKKKMPFYRIVAVDERVKRDGKYIEKIGLYNPISGNKSYIIDEAKALKWLHNGAIPTDTVRSMLSQLGIMKKFHEEKQLKRKNRREVEE
jgi:small subunit ribosomal protein S16